MKDTLDQIDKLIANHEEQIADLQQLKKSLAHDAQANAHSIPGTVTLTRPEYDELVKRYNKACEEGDTQFEFMGHTFLTAYAGYLIEYIGGTA